ncbi:hypothetical protein I6H96_21395 [Brucella anthropi]|uniref:Uncharacterized protein n=1 Tax=Brucella anthropi (strain ATCC 49188 / DSM 6882 / CCUG 24695 / JCM 21032 / LMG 3331 / NBRC 15819 / NCTC 12168 / Alc 37) TaxID=439375 RepID=A6X596_BRUA4|nr:hypothetical protein [Brucella anthropi]ABS16400.1 hypothetical protein Oant_3694 [Brucella anthropi ATCC 49188]NKC49098.1 hypothetical protein [Brucella anthropi ATCC 49188]QQC27287.1 hypothetical protein I6H96_21395 [Brucella anthropi]SUB43709.1 Uncharacterised protein [Brucella anthropi]
MAIFDRLERQLSRTVDRTFSIRFVFTPMRSSPNGRSAVDPERQSWTGKGILEQNFEAAGVEIGKRDGTGNSLQSLVNGHRSEFSVDIHRYPDAVHAKQGDEIQFDDLRRFRVTDTRRDGMSRIVWALTEL